MQRLTLCFFVHLLLCSFPLVCRSVSVSELSLYSLSLYSSMSPCIFHAAFLMNPLLHIQFFIWAYFLSFLSLSFCLPLRLCNSWHCILTAEQFTVCVCMCVHVCVFVYACAYLHVYICAYIYVSFCTLGEQWLNSLSFVCLARPGGVWQWTKCQCVRLEWKPAPSVIACPRSDTLEPIAWDSG